MTEQGSEGGQRPDAKDAKDAKVAWSDAGDRLGVLGSRLKQHYERQSGASGGQAREEVKDAARRLGEAVQSAFDAIGAAAKDPDVKDDVRQVGRSVSDALAGTLTGLSGELRRTFGRQEPIREADQTTSWPTDDPAKPTPAPPVTPASSTDAPVYGTPPATGTPEGTPPGQAPDVTDGE